MLMSSGETPAPNESFFTGRGGWCLSCDRIAGVQTIHSSARAGLGEPAIEPFASSISARYPYQIGVEEPLKHKATANRNNRKHMPKITSTSRVSGKGNADPAAVFTSLPFEHGTL